MTSEDDVLSSSSSSTSSSALAEITVGAVAGLRSALPAAALAWRAFAAHRGNVAATGGAGARPAMAHPLSLAITTVAALGELTVDKLPIAPARIGALPLAGRALSGAWAAGFLARGARRSTARGALYGAVGALAASFGGYYLRRALTHRAASDLVVALAEDALAIGLAALAVSKTPRQLGA